METLGRAPPLAGSLMVVVLGLNPGGESRDAECFIAREDLHKHGKGFKNRRLGVEGFSSVWCSVGNGGMDLYSSPYVIPNNSPHKPVPHSLFRTRQPFQD